MIFTSQHKTAIAALDNDVLIKKSPLSVSEVSGVNPDYYNTDVNPLLTSTFHTPGRVSKIASNV